jgi:hypothetical protein
MNDWANVKINKKMKFMGDLRRTSPQQDMVIRHTIITAKAAHHIPM